jgi:hypothetical protein
LPNLVVLITPLMELKCALGGRSVIRNQGESAAA